MVCSLDLSELNEVQERRITALQENRHEPDSMLHSPTPNHQQGGTEVQGQECLKWHLVQGCQTELVLLKDSVKLLSTRSLFSYILIWWDGGEAWKYVFLEISVSECLCLCVCVCASNK